MKYILQIVFMISIISCSGDGYKNVGSIPFMKETDDESFHICNEAKIEQYYVRRSSDTAPSYKQEKRGLEQSIISQYNFPKSPQENGYITIRFIVNCQGETGRFRIEEMDFDYKPQKFNEKIIGQLLPIVKSLNNWIPRKKNDTNLDFYQYLTFKIEKGQIVKVLP